MKTLQLHASRVSRTRLVMAALAVVLLASPASAHRAANSNAGESLRVDHDGIYLVQREGQCLSGGPCDLGGQCPGSEFVTGRYPNAPLYCGPIGKATRPITNSAPATFAGIAAPSTPRRALSGIAGKAYGWPLPPADP
jgi:hypothetical protein